MNSEKLRKNAALGHGEKDHRGSSLEWSGYGFHKQEKVDR